MPRIAIPVSVRFWSKVRKTESCWIWDGSLFHDGYGLFKYSGKNKRAHRVAWFLENGEIPANLFVCHTCDNLRCVRPDHLFIGSVSDNKRDCVNKKRDAQSKKTHCPKGHEYSQENTRIYNGCRICGICVKAKSLRQSRERRETCPDEVRAYHREYNKMRREQEAAARAI